MNAQSMNAEDVKIGDTIVFRDTRFNFTVEEIHEAASCNISFEYNNNTASAAFGPNDKLSVIRPTPPTNA